MMYLCVRVVGDGSKRQEARRYAELPVFNRLWALLEDEDAKAYR